MNDRLLQLFIIEALEEDDVICKRDDKYVLYTKNKQDDGRRRRLGTHRSRKGAERQKRAIGMAMNARDKS